MINSELMVPSGDRDGQSVVREFRTTTAEAAGRRALGEFERRGLVQDHPYVSDFDGVVAGIEPACETGLTQEVA